MSDQYADRWPDMSTHPSTLVMIAIVSVAALVVMPWWWVAIGLVLATASLLLGDRRSVALEDVAAVLATAAIWPVIVIAWCLLVALVMALDHRPPEPLP